MKEGCVTICGKEVKVAYCAATENGFEDVRGKSIFDIDFKRQQDIVALCLCAIVSAYARSGETAPVDGDTLLYDATPKELTTLMTEVMRLRGEWYEVPKVLADEIKEEDTDGEEKPKN